MGSYTVTARHSECLRVCFSCAAQRMNYNNSRSSARRRGRTAGSFDTRSYPGEDGGGRKDLQVRPPVATVMVVDRGRSPAVGHRTRPTSAGRRPAASPGTSVPTRWPSIWTAASWLITFITPGTGVLPCVPAGSGADIAILVVAADDGSDACRRSSHQPRAGRRRADRGGIGTRSTRCRPGQIREQLTEYGLVPEEFGGDTCSSTSRPSRAPISRRWEGDRVAGPPETPRAGPAGKPDMEAQGVAIGRADRGRSPVATVLVQRGTCGVGDSVVRRRLAAVCSPPVDEHGEASNLRCQIAACRSFTSVPGAGDNFIVVGRDRITRQIADRRSARKRNALATPFHASGISLEDLDSALKKPAS